MTRHYLTFVTRKQQIRSIVNYVIRAETLAPQQQTRTLCGQIRQQMQNQQQQEMARFRVVSG